MTREATPNRATERNGLRKLGPRAENPDCDDLSSSVNAQPLRQARQIAALPNVQA
jgi:hypothetical protein